MNDTVVYRHRKPCGEVFYVGIGTKKRPYKKQSRNKFWHSVVKKHGYEVEVIAEGLSWADACELEEFLISIYGRRDLGTGTLVNLTDGGEGSPGRKLSAIHRKRLSEAGKGQNRSAETRKKMSKAKKGRKLSAEHRKKLSKPKKTMSKVICPHCSKIGSANGMYRWHFDNCKQKP